MASLIFAAIKQLSKNVFIKCSRNAFPLSVLILGVIGGFVFALSIMTSMLINSESFSSVGRKFGYSAIPST